MKVTRSNSGQFGIDSKYKGDPRSSLSAIQEVGDDREQSVVRVSPNSALRRSKNDSVAAAGMLESLMAGKDQNLAQIVEQRPESEADLEANKKE